MRNVERLDWEDYQMVIASLREQFRWRDLLMWLIPGYTAYRVSDYKGITWGDLNEQADEITIVEKKTSKTRTAYLGDNFKEWVSECRIGTRVIRDNAPVLPRLRGGRPGQEMGRGGVNYNLRKLAKEFGLPTVSPHTLRKTVAYKAYESLGANHYALVTVSKNLLNHSNIETTITYLGIRDAELKNVLKSL